MSYRKEAADGFPFYGIFKRLDSTHPASNGLYVLETFKTIDGPRTRVVRGGFHEVGEAQAWIESNQEKTK